MSEALEWTAPAAPTLSKLITAIGRTTPSTSRCGAATLSARALVLVVVRAIPSGETILSRRKSSQLRPETAATTSPAATYMTLL